MNENENNLNETPEENNLPEEEVTENAETVEDTFTETEPTEFPEEEDVSFAEPEEAVLSETEVKLKKAKTSALIAWILVVLFAVGDFGYYWTQIYNKYNHLGYLDTNGMTIGDAAAGMNMSFEEFKEQYGLPKDMKKSTYFNAAQNLIPVSKMLELYGTDLDSMKEQYHFGDEITEDSTWGQALESMTLADYVGEDYFDEFKDEYALGDDVTLETKWGDVRKTVEQKQYDDRIAKEKGITPSPSASAEAEPTASADTAESEAPASEEPSASPEA